MANRYQRDYEAQHHRSYETARSSRGSSKLEAWMEQEDHPLRETNMGFTDTSIRHKFIRKVYAIIFMCLAITFGSILPISLIEPLYAWAHDHWYLGVIFNLCSFVLLCPLACIPKARRAFPLNLVLLLCFSALLGLGIAFSIAAAPQRFKTSTVLGAFALCLIIVLLFTLFAMQTKYDITKFGGIMFLSVIVVVVLSCVWSVVAIFFVKDREAYNIIEIVIASLSLLVFIAHLIYDTQVLLGGSHKYAISPEDYVLGALAIYLDIINIFMTLLRIIAAVQDLQN